MLIVNADDLGYSVTTTNPAVQAYDEGLISSLSAMVWMRDGARAGALARERGMPVGLHLNLTYEFLDPNVPPRAADLQKQMLEQFDRASWDEDELEHAAPDAKIREAIKLQLDEFRRHFGEPTHLDGHHHVHVHPRVLASLPTEWPIRPVLRPPQNLSRPLSVREAWLRRRFRGPDVCLNFQHMHPLLGGSGLTVLERAREQTVEVMVHPQDAREREALRTPEWGEVLARLKPGSYRDLAELARR